MKFGKISSMSNLKLMFIMMTMVALVTTGFAFSNVNGDNEKLDLGADVSGKGMIEKSGEDASVNANVSASASSSSSNAKSEDNSHEDLKSSSEINDESQNSQSSSEMNAESHENYKMSYEKMNADSNNSFTVDAGHHIYKPGDQVSIEGSIWTNLMQTVGGISSVSIEVTDNVGTVVYSGTGQVNSNGDYSTEFQLPSDAKNGAYEINVKSDTSADVLNTLSLKTQSSLQSSTKFVVVSPNAFAIKAEGKDFDVQIASNSSSVTNMKFDEQGKKLSFTVQGETGTKGVTEIKIPKSLLSGNLNVMIDGQAMSQSDVIEKADTNDEVTLELNYHHSTHQIDIVGTNAVPEFSSLVSLVLVASILSVIVLSMKTRVLNIANRS